MSTVIGALPTSRQASYSRWPGKHEADRGAYPTSFADVCETVIAFADPLLNDTAITHSSAARRQWH